MPSQQTPLGVLNFISVAVSICLGLGLTCLLNDICNCIKVRRRVKPYWVHSIWVGVTIGLHFQLWFGFWNYHSVKWTFWAFSGYMLSPSLLFVIADLLFPDLSKAEHCGDTFDMRAHFDAIRCPLFLTYTLYLVIVSVLAYCLKPPPYDPPIAWMCRLTAIACVFAAAFASTERRQGSLALAALMLFVLFVFSPNGKALQASLPQHQPTPHSHVSASRPIALSRFEPYSDSATLIPFPLR